MVGEYGPWRTRLRGFSRKVGEYGPMLQALYDLEKQVLAYDVESVKLPYPIPQLCIRAELETQQGILCQVLVYYSGLDTDHFIAFVPYIWFKH